MLCLKTSAALVAINFKKSFKLIGQATIVFLFQGTKNDFSEKWRSNKAYTIGSDKYLFHYTLNIHGS